METWPALETHWGLCLLRAKPVPWDTEIFKYRVGIVDAVALDDSSDADLCLGELDSWIRDNQVRLTSCRLEAERLRESMALEEIGFRFIETILHPHIDLDQFPEVGNTSISIQLAAETDVPTIVSWASRSFRFERYHTDPRVDINSANQRYGHWIEDAWRRKSNRLYKAVDESTGALRAFFLTNDSTPEVDWLLTAVHPDHQGQGIGPAAWRAMMEFHRASGGRSISTTISSRNSPVMRLYGKLGFSFTAPEITLHRVDP